MDRIRSFFVNNAKNPELLKFVAGLMLVHHVTFYGSCAFFTWADRAGIFHKYKIQARSPDPKLVRQALAKSLFNNLVFFPLVAAPILYKALKRRGLDMDMSKIPSVWSFIGHIAFRFIMADTTFYWLHRLLHTPFLFKHVHKIHHRFYTPIGLASEYAHPLEDLTANGFSTMSGALIFPGHITHLWAYLVIRLLETVDAHSGFELPWSPFRNMGVFLASDGHDWHHSGQKGTDEAGCYGMMKFWDWLMGTDKAFKDWKERGMPDLAVVDMKALPPANKQFTADEVAQHSKPGDCFVTLHGHVYDVTSYIDQHPGGKQVLLSRAGTDVSQAFEKANHPPYAISRAAPFLQGTLRS